MGYNIGDIFGSPFGVDGGVNLSDLVSWIINISYMIAGFLILFLFLIGGFYIIMGAGQDNPESSAKGKKAMTAAGAGFLIVFTAYWVIRIIEIITGNNFVTNP